MTIKIISLNVNGIRDKPKRQTIFHWLISQNAEIFMLQETHCESDEDILLWSKEWQGKAYWSKGTNFSRGVAILIKPKLDIEINHVNIDIHGRFVSIIFD